MENRGQISLEYILIFAISLIILMVFTLPLAEESIKNTLDVSDSLDIKYEQSKIVHAIKQVYGEGQGSKKTVNIQSPKKIKVNIASNYISCNLKLKNGQNKIVKENYKSNIKKTSITLTKGSNVIVVEWPMNADNMVVYKKLF